MDDPLRSARLACERGGSAGGRFEQRRRIRPPRARLGVGEVVEQDRPSRFGERRRERHQHRVLPVPARAVAQHDDRLAIAEERSHCATAVGKLQLAHRIGIRRIR